MNPQPSNVVRFAPRNRHAYLNYGVYDVLRDVPSAAKAGLVLQQRGVYLLGQLVQMTEEELLSVPSIDAPAIEGMKDRLGKIDFGFGMRIPSWNRNFRDFLAGRCLTRA
jgi:hypothetical protein